jgi:hypothetical protein
MRTVAKLVIKFFTLFFFLNVLAVIFSYYVNILNSAYLDQISEMNGIGIGVIILFYCSGGLLLLAAAALILFIGWWRTDWVARKMIGDMDESQLVISGNSEEIYKVLIKFLGVYLIVTSLSFVLGHLPWVLVLLTAHSEHTAYFSPSFALTDFMFEQISPWLTNIVTLVIGVFLAVGGRNIARGLASIKYIGLEKSTEEEKKPEE